MINTLRTRAVDTVTYPLFSLAPAIEEGALLSNVLETGLTKVTVTTTPTATIQFAGIAYSYFTQPTYTVQVETFTLPATGAQTVTLTFTPTSANFMLVKDSAGKIYTVKSGNGGYALSGNVVTFDAATSPSIAGTQVTFTYRYTPTVIQAQFLIGDGTAGLTRASDVTGSMGVIRRGIVYTSAFNSSVDWSTLPALYLGNSGIIDVTANTSGPLINGYVVEPPSNDVPFLGIYFSA